MNTEERKIGEATMDLCWGIGVDIRHPNVLDERYLTVNNRLGKALMKVRFRLTQK